MASLDTACYRHGDIKPRAPGVLQIIANGLVSSVWWAKGACFLYRCAFARSSRRVGWTKVLTWLSHFRFRISEDLEALSPNDHLHGEVDSRLISCHETVDLLIGRLAFGFFEFNPQL